MTHYYPVNYCPIVWIPIYDAYGYLCGHAPALPSFMPHYIHPVDFNAFASSVEPESEETMSKADLHAKYKALEDDLWYNMFRADCVFTNASDIDEIKDIMREILHCRTIIKKRFYVDSSCAGHENSMMMLQAELQYIESLKKGEEYRVQDPRYCGNATAYGPELTIQRCM